MSVEIRIGKRNATFQRWQAILGNSTKRRRSGEFLVQGVRAISLAIEYNWTVRTLIYPEHRELSRWARETLRSTGAEHVAMAEELVRELGQKEEELPELLAVVALPSTGIESILAKEMGLVVLADRPASPGNIGSLIRSADAFGASGVLVTGHAADPFDPRSVRASTGSIFAIPVARAGSPREVLDQVARLDARGIKVRIVATDENGSVDIRDQDLTGPTIVLIGNETHGLSAAWREAADQLMYIPMGGAASSLSMAAAATIVLYEGARQRGSSPSSAGA